MELTVFVQPTAKIVTSKTLTLPLLNLKLGLETPLSPMKTDKEN